MAEVNLHTETEEEWVWVEGYKGTDKDMQCKGYQYELGKRFDMPEGETVHTCHSGFHFCPDLLDVYGYYAIGDGNRFFKVKGLVRKSDVENVMPSILGKPFVVDASKRIIRAPVIPADVRRRKTHTEKYAAKSIEFVEELSVHDIFAPLVEVYPEEYSEWGYDTKHYAIENEKGIAGARFIHQTNKLVSVGYSEPFAKIFAGSDLYQIAYAAGCQEDLSMDMKVWMIMTTWQGRLTNMTIDSAGINVGYNSAAMNGMMSSSSTRRRR